jgi:hypothetical protein
VSLIQPTMVGGSKMVGSASPRRLSDAQECHVVALEPTLRGCGWPGDLSTTINAAPKMSQSTAWDVHQADQRRPEGAALNSPGWSAAEPRVSQCPGTSPERAAQRIRAMIRVAHRRHTSVSDPGDTVFQHRITAWLFLCQSMASMIRDCSAKGSNHSSVARNPGFLPPPSGAEDEEREREGVPIPGAHAAWLSSAAASRLVFRGCRVLDSTDEFGKLVG